MKVLKAMLSGYEVRAAQAYDRYIRGSYSNMEDKLQI